MICCEYINRSSGAAPLKEQAPCWIEKFDEWLKKNSTDGSSGLPLEPDEFMNKLRDFVKTPTATVEFPQDIGFVGEGDKKELKFVQFLFDSTYEPPASYARAQPILDSWDDFMNEMNSAGEGSGAQGVSRGYATGG